MVLSAKCPVVGKCLFAGCVRTSYRIGRQFAVTLATAAVLTACGFAPTPLSLPAPTPPPLVDQLIAKSSGRIAAAWEIMARTEAAASPVALASPIDLSAVPPQLQMPVTWDWSGPADQAVAALAGRIGYAFHQAGDRPVIPIIVSVHAAETPAVLVLRDIGLQAGARARIDTDPNSPGSITYTNTADKS